MIFISRYSSSLRHLDLKNPRAVRLGLNIYAIKSIERALDASFGEVDQLSILCIPSVTNFVYEVEVNGVPYIAKMSFLGLSKPSLEKKYSEVGIERVFEMQDDYSKSEDNIIQHETSQLRLLRDHLSIGIPSVVNYHDGVLVMGKVHPSYPLQEELGSDTTLELPMTYGGLAEKLYQLHRLARNAEVRSKIAGQYPVAHSKTDTITKFRRKFLSGDSIFQEIALLGGNGYFAQIAEIYRESCRRLGQLMDKFPFDEREVIVHGDFKPENILISNGRVFFIDPDLHLGRPSLDIGRLISRTSVSLLYEGGSELNKSSTRDAIDSFIGAVHDVYSLTSDLEREVIAVCCMDILNIMSTYLALDPGSVTEYPVNVQQNYRHGLEVVTAVSHAIGIDSLRDFALLFNTKK